MEGEVRIDTAMVAELAVRRHLELHYPGRILEVRVVKVWYHTGKAMDIWEVQGFMVVKKGLLRKERRPFRLQVSPTTGEVVGFEE